MFYSPSDEDPKFYHVQETHHARTVIKRGKTWTIVICPYPVKPYFRLIIKTMKRKVNWLTWKVNWHARIIETRSVHNCNFLEFYLHLKEKKPVNCFLSKYIPRIGAKRIICFNTPVIVTISVPVHTIRDCLNCIFNTTFLNLDINVK